MSVTSFTSKYFSSLLINEELSNVKEACTAKSDPLADENMTIKISNTVAEIKAVYVVDEQPMELTVRIPPEYPLQQVEVKDLKKVGVSDATWRAWILAIQQTIVGVSSISMNTRSGLMRKQGGHIASALELFKRNVTLHFEGVEACAICYSVISLGDRRLPTKKCRTCKNAFHASCLFKVCYIPHPIT